MENNTQKPKGNKTVKNCAMFLLLIGIILFIVAGVKLKGNTQEVLGLSSIGIIILSFVLIGIFREPKTKREKLNTLPLQDASILEYAYGKNHLWNTNAERDAALTAEKQRIAESNMIFYTVDQLKYLIKVSARNLNEYKATNTDCPICNAKLIYEDCKVKAQVTKEREISGLYVGYTTSEYVKKAKEYHTEEEILPALKFHCPHCEWVRYLSIYHSYVKEREIESNFSTFGTTYEDLGERWVWRQQIASFFSQGRLYDKTFHALLHDKNDNTVFSDFVSSAKFMDNAENENN